MWLESQHEPKIEHMHACIVKCWLFMTLVKFEATIHLFCVRTSLYDIADKGFCIFVWGSMGCVIWCIPYWYVYMQLHIPLESISSIVPSYCVQSESTTPCLGVQVCTIENGLCC